MSVLWESSCANWLLSDVRSPPLLLSGHSTLEVAEARIRDTAGCVVGAVAAGATLLINLRSDHIAARTVVACVEGLVPIFPTHLEARFAAADVTGFRPYQLTKMASVLHRLEGVDLGNVKYLVLVEPVLDDVRPIRGLFSQR